MTCSATLSLVRSFTVRICTHGCMGRHGPASWAARAVAVLITAMLALPRPAAAVDGCLVMLCFAAPSWRAIPRCVPPIREVLRELARGKAFPTCAMAGVGNSARNDWATAPRYCPPQYTHLLLSETGPTAYCDYTGAVSVSVNGTLFSRTWWNVDGGSVTEFSRSAKTQLGGVDTQFDTDYANWLSTPPPVATMDSNP